MIDSHELNNLCVEFMIRLVEIPINPEYDFYHIDEKVEKGSGRKTNAKNEVIKNLNVLNVYSDLLRMCIDQEMIEEKTNEITAIPDVIKRLNVKNVICTWDALNTEKNIVEAVIQGKGDYVGALKGNQGSFYQDVIDYFDEDKLMIIQSGYEGAYKEELEKSHNQVIKYEYYQTEDIKWYEDVKSWKGLKSIGLVVKKMERIRKMEHDLNLIKLISENIEPQNEEQKRIKLYLETHKGNCEEYIAKSAKYKERVICLKSIYHSIVADLLHEICQQIYVD